MWADSLAARTGALGLAFVMGASTLAAQSGQNGIVSATKRTPAEAGVPSVPYVPTTPRDKAMTHSENGKIGIYVLAGLEQNITPEREAAIKAKVAQIFGNDSRVETFVKVDNRVTGLTFFAFVDGKDYVSLVTKEDAFLPSQLANESVGIRARADNSATQTISRGPVLSR